MKNVYIYINCLYLKTFYRYSAEFHVHFGRSSGDFASKLPIVTSSMVSLFLLIYGVFAKVCDLVCLFILNKLACKFGDGNALVCTVTIG